MQIRAAGRRIRYEGERDCPIRRCCQALVGEAPPPGLPRAIRDGLRRSVVDFGRATGYRSLGRVAFLVEVQRGASSFLEMNARIEVEHPVTEAIAGPDPIALQIAIVEGRPLAIARDSIALRGHAIDCRLNAEDGARGFMPARAVRRTRGSRTGPDCGRYPHDPRRPGPAPLRLTARRAGRPRRDAGRRHRHDAHALRVVSLTGVPANAGLPRAIMAGAAFARGGVDTAWGAGLLPPLHGDGGG